MPALPRLLTSALRAAGELALRELQRSAAAPRRAPEHPGAGAERPRPRAGRRPAGAAEAPAGSVGAAGAGAFSYAPREDGRPDPGEVVWAWVPFEEGDGRGKDRPVLVVGRTGPGPDADLLALAMTSKDHDRDAADEARRGRRWVDVGTGAWDRRGRPSEVRVDRLLRVAPADVRREGAALDRARFERVAREAREALGG
ncbi:type II toxin-antitoxin system PemK/MazF family toxin [Kineococcus sp. SYSU DK005]|uniref:type II toxin-antitoxin system PemK/MazF family toxin n=1 Tax=Kineococcus sp. SYSU DK005 TaxID=3383126 RepID=UPI003D7C6308